MQHDYERNYLLMNVHEKVAFCYLVSVVNIEAYNETTETVSDCFLTWDILEDAMPFLSQPALIPLSNVQEMGFLSGCFSLMEVDLSALSNVQKVGG